MQVLTGATLIDGTGRIPVSDVAVVLNDAGRIEEVGPRAAVTIPPGATTYDVTGLTLMPGLIDCHDHLSSHGTSLAERFALAEPISTGHVRTAKVLEQVLRTGYTTVRDGGWLDVGFKQAIEQKLINGPRLVLATSPISPIGGLADRVSPSGHSCVQPHGYIDPNLPDGVATGTNEVRRKVREMVRAGADVVKFATTGGASSRVGHGPKEVEFDRDEIDMLVQEASALGRRAMCHALGGPGLRMAIEAGVHSIEHGTYLDEDPDLLPMMADKGIFFVPTFTVYVYHGTQGNAPWPGAGTGFEGAPRREPAPCSLPRREGGGWHRRRSLGPPSQCPGDRMLGGRRHDPHAGHTGGHRSGRRMPRHAEGHRHRGEGQAGRPDRHRRRPPPGRAPAARCQ